MRPSCHPACPFRCSFSSKFSPIWVPDVRAPKQAWRGRHADAESRRRAENSALRLRLRRVLRIPGLNAIQACDLAVAQLEQRGARDAFAGRVAAGNAVAAALAVR